MKQIVEELRSGALLGDIVEALTGHDLMIDRKYSKPLALGNGTYCCTHTTAAHSGAYALGVAKVTWTGSRARYASIIEHRMREFLRANRLVAHVRMETPDRMNRVFRLSEAQGTLVIEETIFLEGILRLLSNTPTDHEWNKRAH